jgi:hypothetical protein
MKRASRRPLLSLHPAEVAGDRGGRLFMGRLDTAALRQALEQRGIMAAVAARGHAEPSLTTSVETGEHRLCLRPARGRLSLVDLRLHETTLVVEEPLLCGRGVELLSVLDNTWLSLQDPRAFFTPERPRLPGQRYPGLGLCRAFYELMTGWAREWGKDAVVVTPEYFHNAVFYQGGFRFLAPADQGRFEALRRDLRALHVASASAVLAEGGVRDAATGLAYRWSTGPMLAPLIPSLVDYLDSPDYRRAADAARDAARFALRSEPR